MLVRVSLVVLVLIGTAAIVYGQLTALGPLQKIVVSNVARDGRRSWQIEIDGGDRYVFHDGAVDTTGRIAFAPYAQRLAAVSEVRYLPSSQDHGTGLTVWVQGRRRTVQRFVASQATGHAPLLSFAAALQDAVTADARRLDAPRIAALTSLNDLVAFEIVLDGCFGRCGVYDEILRRGGGGELRWQGYPGTVSHRAPAVAWQRVVRALHAAHVERLDRKYLSGTVDAGSAALRFVFPRVTYTVEAPDSTMWPHELVVTAAEMRHLAHDMSWSPALRADQLRTLAW